jgi:hypothetical protein
VTDRVEYLVGDARDRLGELELFRAQVQQAAARLAADSGAVKTPHRKRSWSMDCIVDFLSALDKAENHLRAAGERE